MTFAKLDNGITKSSIWSEPYHVRVVWISFLAEKDETGFVSASRSGMIRLCNVTSEEFDEAEMVLSSPDPDSRTPDFNGKRIDKVDGGWIVLNHEKYRLSEDVKKERHRQYMRDWRDKKEDVNSREFTKIHKRSPSVSVSVSVSESVSESVSDKNKAISMLEYWNLKKDLIHHRQLSKTMTNYISARLKEFSEEELKKCIDNYSMVLSDQKYWYTYKHALDEFFRSGERKLAPYVKFLPERFVEENFLAKKGGGYNGKPVSQNCKPDDQYSSVY